MWLIERLAGVRERLRRPSLQDELGYRSGESGRVYLERLRQRFRTSQQGLMLDALWNVSTLGALAFEWEETDDDWPGPEPALARSGTYGVVGLRQDIALALAESFGQLARQIESTDNPSESLILHVAQWQADELAADFGSEKKIEGHDFFRRNGTVYVTYRPQIMAYDTARSFESYLPFCGLPKFLAGEIRAAVLSDWSNGEYFIQLLSEKGLVSG
jgi:hypothetical protein